MHEHAWFPCYRQLAIDGQPPVQVVDCACGARAKIYPSPYGLPEIRLIEPEPGGSPANCLIRDNESVLGDPQGDRLTLLNTLG